MALAIHGRAGLDATMSQVRPCLTADWRVRRPFPLRYEIGPVRPQPDRERYGQGPAGGAGEQLGTPPGPAQFS